MNAAADYAAARAALGRALPAYVSYRVSSHVVGPMNIAHDDVTSIVVRSSDGKIVKGKPPDIKMGADNGYANDVVRHAPFDPACYRATSAKRSIFDARPLEAISLNALCEKGAHSGDFDTLYVDPATREPVAVIGGNKDDGVAVVIEQRYAREQRFILPSSFDVTVKGSGLMFWLNVAAHEAYSRYTFTTTPP